ncbi:serine/threonine-protein kinase [Nocardioides ferulae]|uniref:serine/threonine-protein kinase n=1 Tax=Nocardioides ferulae TaxID=2340821 RepID=UPI000EAB7BAC|nr:serine/threonine-protein kinase [Nocardioides ferulae]
MTSPPPADPGTTIGPYRLGRRLGGGGMGVVHEAHDTVLGRSVALKLITPGLADDPAFRARFTREAQAQARLDSPHVVHVYAHGEADGHLYLATQLVPDGDLGGMLRVHGVPPLRVAAELVAQVAAGLADAHAGGLVHRDIKPANVLLRRRADGFTAYLADFGIARPVLAEQTHATVGTVGTPGYMAPELHDGAPATVASDVYAVGCLLWTTLTGRPPYAGATDFQVATAHRDQPVPQLPGAGAQVEALNRVLRTAMAKQPVERYATAMAMRDDLRAVLALPDTPAPVRPGSAEVPPPGRARGQLVALAAVAALVLGGLAATAYAVLGGEREPARSAAGAETTGQSEPVGGVDASDPVGEASTEPPTDPSTEPGAPSAEDRERAVSTLAAALAAEGPITSDQAECAARGWIEAAGLEEMAAAGYFDEQWNYVDQPEEDMPPEIRSAIFSAVTACVTG